MPRKVKVAAKEVDVQQFIRDNPETFVQILKGRRPKLSYLFPGENNQPIRQSIVDNGFYRAGKGELRLKTIPTDDGDHEIVALGAISFDPGPTINIIDNIQDFSALVQGKQKQQEVEQLWQIYKQEGLINNAINKIAAILSGGGHFKVRNAKQGRKPEATNRLLTILQAWQEKLNSSAPEAVITGARGLQSVLHQGVRRALVEGDWFARHVWAQFEVLNVGKVNLPMNIQSISSGNLEPVEGLAGTGAEAFFWKPSATTIQALTNPTNKDAAKILKKFIPREYQNPLKKDGKVLIDPALMLHVRHRGVDTDTWGESFITPALQAIAYKRAIDQLDFQTMQNLINRLTIVMVGSSDPNSPYANPDVSAARQALMASFFEEPGPNMTIIWAGDDVKVENIGADNVLNLDQRHEIGVSKIKQAVGVPEALLSGSMSEKASGIAASMGAAAQLEELQNAFAKVITQLAELIAEENGFTDVDIIFEFDKALFVDRVEEWNQARSDYIAGLSTIFDYLARLGKDPNAVFAQKCFEKGLDPATTSWEEAFMPPQGMAGQEQTTGTPPVNGPAQGRQPDSQKGLPKQQERKPNNTSRENK